jgi:hypothetical protein
MPRFEDKHITCLKQAMLRRIPECYFLAEDRPAIMEETGLCQAQIEQWAKNLRARLPVAHDREAFLRSSGEPDKVCDHLKFGVNQTRFG